VAAIEALTLQFGELVRARLLDLGARKVFAFSHFEPQQVFQVALELAAALLGACTRLDQLEHVDLLGMHARLYGLQLTAQRIDALPRLGGGGFGT